jgi:hypothetical protein
MMILPRAGRAQSSTFIPYGTNGAGSTSKFAIPSVALPPGASVLEGRGVSGSNGGASSPLPLGFSTDALYIGGETLLTPDSSSSTGDYWISFLGLKAWVDLGLQ